MSVSSAGEQGNANSGTRGFAHVQESLVSDDGQIVAFASLASNFDENDTSNNSDVYVRYRDGRLVTRRPIIFIPGILGTKSDRQ